MQAWALEGDLDATAVRSNTFAWSGRRDRASSASSLKWTGREWFALAEARERINPAQAAFLERLAERYDS